MSIQNINTLQNPIDFSQLSTYSNEYLLQSLANLGQRLSIKGDSIKTRGFSFIQLFANQTYDENNFVGCIEAKNNSVYFHILNKDTFINVDTEILSNSNDYLITNTNVSLNTTINGVDHYLTNGFIRSSDTHFYTGFVGVNSNNEIIEIVVDSFNKYDSKILTEGIRIVNVKSSSEGEKLIMMHIKNDVNGYYLSVHEANKNITIEFVSELLKSAISDDTEPNKTTEFFYNVLINSFTKNETKYELELINENQFKLNDSILKSKYTNINTKLGYFGYDIYNFYPFIKEYHSKLLYLNNNDDLAKQIFNALFKIIIANSTTSTKIYLPINYTLNFYYNSNNVWQIYGGVDDVVVKYTSEDIYENTINTLYDPNNILCTTNLDERCVLFNYNVEYDVNNEDVIYDIKAYKKYVLPYINANDYWVINDNVTTVKAKGEDAGNPNIIIVYNKTKNNIKNAYDILSGANKNNILNNLSWEIKQTFIEPLENINLNDVTVTTASDLYTLNCWIPNLSKIPDKNRTEWINKLQYSLIISVSSVNCFENISNAVLDRYGEYGVVTTFWAYNEESEEFEVLLKQSPFGNNKYVALDINYLTNINNMIKWNVTNMELKHPDKYTHEWLVFKQSYVTLKNNTEDYKKEIYGNVLNVNAIDFNKADYRNDFNLIIKYNESVPGAKTNEISAIPLSQDYKYLGSMFNSANRIETTNSIYTYRNAANKYSNYSEWLPNINVPMFNSKEIFHQNFNTINRTNILTVSQEGYIYNSYIGSSFNINDKTALHIGTSNENINIGLDTLINETDRNKFVKNTTLHLDFPNTYINGYSYIQDNLIVKHDIYTYHQNYYLDTLTKNNKAKTKNVFVNTTFTPISKFVFQTDSVEYGFGDVLQLNNSKLIRNQISKLSEGYKKVLEDQPEDDVKLWVPIFYTCTDEMVSPLKWVYLCDGIFIPALLKRLRLDKWVDLQHYSHINIKSNQKIIYNNQKPLLLFTQNRFIDFELNVMDDNGILRFNYDFLTDEIFIGNDLKIVYNIEGDVLNITINEQFSGQTIQNLFEPVTNYNFY